MDRRDFIKALGAAVAAMSIPSGMGSSGKYASSAEFDNLWNLMKDYQAVNKYFLVGAKSSKSNNEAWKKAVDFNNTQIGEIDLNTRDSNELKAFFEKYGKVVYNGRSLSNPEQRCLTLGTIADEWSDNLHWTGPNPHGEDRDLDYRVVAFTQDARTIDDFRGSGTAIGRWNKKNETVYNNITSMEKTAKIVYNKGMNINKEQLDEEVRYFEQGDEKEQAKIFNKYMMKELYDVILQDTIQENPELAKASPSSKRMQNAFLRTAVNIIQDLNIRHEITHNYFPNEKTPEGQHKEVETFCYEGQNKYNSRVFRATMNNYPAFYEALENKGYTRERMIKMTPEQRGEMFKEMLPCQK